MAKVVRINLEPPEAELIDAAAAVLRRGGLVAFPTETVYGLGARALDAEAVGKIFKAKGRPAHNPVIVHVADAEQVAQVAGAWPPLAQALASRFWPGPLTLVLPRHERVPLIVTAGGPTVAVRLPAHPVARALLRALGEPVAAPSANRSTELSATTAEHVARNLGAHIDLILDGGPTAVGIESTVLDLVSDPPRLLRPGHITRSQIEEVIGPILHGVEPAPPDQPLRGPGLLPRHYSPKTRTEYLNDGATRVRELAEQGSRVGWLTFHHSALDPQVVAVEMPTDPQAYAARLYAELHRLDQMRLEVIVIDQVPAQEPWLAIDDRLRRAATGEH